MQYACPMQVCDARRDILVHRCGIEAYIVIDKELDRIGQQANLYNSDQSVIVIMTERKETTTRKKKNKRRANSCTRATKYVVHDPKVAVLKDGAVFIHRSDLFWRYRLPAKQAGLHMAQKIELQ